MRTSSICATVFTAAFIAAAPALGADSTRPGPGLEIGARTGYAFSAGHLGAPPNGTDNNLGDYVGGQLPLWLDVGYRLNADIYLGGFVQYGFGSVNDDRQNQSRNANVDCSASDIRLGVMGRYHLQPIGPALPWVGLGVGYEWGSYSQHQSVLGNTNSDSSWSGFEIANLQTGADFRIAPRVLVAPFISFSVGQFRNTSATTTFGTTTTTTEQELEKKSLHEWIFIGARMSFMP
jgi:opacity protein-like surface antigen